MTAPDRDSSESAAGVVHDIRSALGLITSLAANVRDGLDGPISAGQFARCSRIVEIAVDAGALLERLNNPNPIAEEGAPRMFDVAAFARDIVGRLDLDAERRGITLVAPIGDSEFAFAEPLELGRAIANVVGNALKFTPSPGRVVVQVGRVADGSEAIEIAVLDSGPGIPAEACARMLRAGERLARDAHHPGTGLGLAIAGEIMARLGGSIQIGEAAGGGARVALLIPSERDRSFDEIDSGERSTP